MRRSDFLQARRARVCIFSIESDITLEHASLYLTQRILCSTVGAGDKKFINNRSLFVSS